jgi:hypothetical protein
MAFTERFVATDATVGPFAIGFNYQDANNLKVVLMELDESNPQQITFSFAGTPSEAQPAGTTVVLNTAYPSGKQLRIYKEVDLDTPRVDWQASAVFNEETLNSMTINLMEMAQTAYDAAERSRTIALATANELDTIEADLQAQLDAAEAAAVSANFWAQIALNAGSTANPEAAAAVARDAAIAARDAAIAAQVAAEAARDLANGYSTAAQVDATAAESSADDAEASAIAAAASAATAQSIVDTGSLKWSGSLKFVSVLDPNPALGANGDFWFKREV